MQTYPHFLWRTQAAWDKGANDGNNNGQAMHGARKPPGPKITEPKISHIIF